MNIKVIGIGGIGSDLVGKLARFLHYSVNEPIPMTLIDGDEYEEKNRERQEFRRLGNKAYIKSREIMKQYYKLDVDSIEEYITEDTVRDSINDRDVVFLCVDNHKTRRLVSNHCKTIKNVVLISGGNELTDGNVQIYIREHGVDMTPDLTSYHPEILNPDDKSPDEMSCEELSVSEPQLYFTNIGVSTFMCFAFWNVVIERNNKVCEVYFDMKLMAADPKIRPVKRS